MTPGRVVSVEAVKALDHLRAEVDRIVAGMVDVGNVKPEDVELRINGAVVVALHDAVNALPSPAPGWTREELVEALDISVVAEDRYSFERFHGRLARQDLYALADVCLSRAPGGVERPHIVCLCGSTRFWEQFQKSNYEETMAGHIVLSVGFYPHAQRTTVQVDGCMGPETVQAVIVSQHNDSVGCTPEQKIALDELHKRKIDLADEILVLNIGGYFGDSTRSEIEYAKAHGKPVRWLEPALGAEADRG